MSEATEEEAKVSPEEETQAEAETTDEPTSSEAESGTVAAEDITEPEFASVDERVVRRLESSPERLHGVSVPVWAELGRVEMLIGDLLQLGEGSVVRLDRLVGDPVDLVSQGVKLARGEVIVVDECFAIRIREVVSGSEK